MLDLLSQNRLVALGLLLIAVYGATTYMNSDDDKLSSGNPEQIEMPQERVEASAAEEPRPTRRPPPPPSPEEFNEASEDGDEGLIDDTAGFDPSPEGGSEGEPSSDDSDDGNGYIPTTGGSSPEGEVSVIVDNAEIESQFN